MRRPSQALGLSMVELMVAMTLGMLLTAAVLQTFIGAKRTYEFQNAFARVQENGRFAMGFLSKDVRQADFWGCLKDPSAMTSHLVPASYASGSGFSGVKDLTQGVNVVDAASPYTPPIGPVPDMILLRSGGGGGATLTSAAGASVKMDKATLPSGVTVKPGDIFFVAECNKGAILQITNTQPSNNTVVFNPGNLGFAPGNLPSAVGALTGYGLSEAKLFSSGGIKYWIRTGAGGQPALYRGDADDSLTSGGQELVEGIENMQILLGYDPDGDGTAEYFSPPPPLVAGDLSEVVSVQISLVVRSLADGMTESPTPFEFNGTTLTPPSGDTYLRKVFSTNIAIRNRLE